MKLMNHLCAIIILNYLSATLSIKPEDYDVTTEPKSSATWKKDMSPDQEPWNDQSVSPQYYTTTEHASSTWMNDRRSSDQDSWNVKLDINFSETLPNQRKPLRADVRVKYEMNIDVSGAERNATKEDVEASLKNLPIDYILRSFMKNVNTNLLKEDESRVNNLSTKLVKNDNDDTIYKTSESLDLSPSIGTELNEDIMEYSTHYAIQQIHGSNEGEGTQEIEFPVPTAVILNSKDDWKRPCQIYTGNACRVLLSDQYVFIPNNSTMFALEVKLKKALNVLKESSDISVGCEPYAMKFLCHSTFPRCSNLLKTYDSFGDYFSDQHLQATEGYSKIEAQTTSICNEDCEAYGFDVCQTELVAVMNRPNILDIILPDFPLGNCQDLPIDDHDCLSLGIPHLPANHKCYYGDGNSHEYLGRARTSIDGFDCLKWTEQTQVNVADYPYLEKQRNYCRNPGGTMSRPWCVVENQDQMEVQICDIPQCSFWDYYTRNSRKHK